MFRPRWRKVLHDLWDNKLRTLLVVFSIAVGVFAVGLIAGAYEIISNDLSVSYASANPANIVLNSTDFHTDLVSVVGNIPDVKDVEGRRSFNVRVRIPGGEWTNIDLLANADFENSTINLLNPIEGKTFPADRELVLEKKVLDNLDVQIGDTLEIQLQDNTIRQLPVVGIVQDQTTSAGDFLASPLGFVTFESLSWLRQPEAFNRLYATVEGDNNDEDHIRQVSDQISDKLEKAGNPVLRTQLSKTGEHPMASTLNAVLGILGALGVLIVFLSSSLIANTLNALLIQHQRFIGVMKLVGARSKQIFAMYMALILAFGILALIIAVPLGAKAAYIFAEYVAVNLNFNLLGERLVPFAIAIQIVIGLAIPLIAGLFPVIKGSRTTVQAAISGTGAGVSSKRKGWIDRTLEKVRFLSRPLLISLRNTFRRKSRLVLTLATLTMGGAIFIGVFNVQATLENYIASIGRYFLADVTLNFSEPYRINEITSEAMLIPGVEYVEGWAFVSGDAIRSDGSIGETIQILAPPADSALVDPILLDGRWIIPGDEKAITVSESILSSFPGVEAGDTLRLKVLGQEEDWTVVGIFRFVDAENLLAYANYDYISKMLNTTNQSLSYRITSSCPDIECQEALTARVDQHFRDAGYAVSQVQPGLASLQTASESLDILINFLLIMALLTAVVGSIGLTGTMGMNVLERTREIGVMRSIGAIDWQIIKSVLFEGILIGVISFVLAVLLSFPISSLLANIISLAIFNTPIALAFTWTGFAIWLGLVLVFSTLASVLPAHNASRLTIREVLAYE